MNYLSKDFKSIICLFFLLLFCLFSASAQSVNGDDSMDQGETKTYFLVGGGLTNINWGVTQGSLESTNGGYQMEIKSTTGANMTISVTYNQSGSSGPGGTGKTVQVRPKVPVPNFLVTYLDCDPTLERQASPSSSLVKWYWQGKDNPNGQLTTLGFSDTFSISSSGNYYLRAYNGYNWSQSSASQIVNMPSAPNVPSVSGNNPREICEGQNTTMSISGADPNLTYKWYKGSTYLGGDGPSKTVSPSTSAVYSVTATNSAGCVSSPRTITVNILNLPLPIANNGTNDCTSTDIVVSVNNTKTVNGTVRNDMTHVWYRNSDGTNPITAQTVPNTPSGTLATQITVTNQTDTSYWVATRIGGCESGLTRVDANFVDFSLSPGGIGGAGTICYNTDPNNLTSTSGASGGNGNFEYFWQYANGQNGQFFDIPNTNSAAFNPSTNLTSDRWYRRKVTSCNGNYVAYSNKIKITVYPVMTGGGSIQASDDSTICYGTDPATINSTSIPTGGNGYTYQWQYASSENGMYTAISNSNVASYNPSTDLTASRWYRRKVTSCGQTAFSNKIQIAVHNDLTNGGTITAPPPVCFNGDPNVIASTSLPTGGGNRTYQWQYASTENGTYTPISNSNTENYNPSNLTDSRWYQRKVTSCGQTRFSNKIQVMVYPALTSGGTLGAPDSICYNANPEIIASNSAAVGGNDHTYQWEYAATQNGPYTVISNSNVEAYDPPNLTASRWYRRRVSSCGQEQLSNSVELAVVPVLSAPESDDEVFYCGTGQITIQVTKDTDADSARWYTSATGGIHFYEGDTYNAPTQNETYYVSSYSNTGCESNERKQIMLIMATDITWSLDADDDDFAIQQQQSCESPGAGWKPEDLPLGDCDDGDASITIPKIWYADSENNGQGDGLGDPNNPSEFLCVAPQGYVDNSDDQCPTVSSPTNDCQVTYPPDPCGVSTTSTLQFTGDNYVYTRTYQKSAEEMGISTSTNLPFFTENENLVQEITYFDGLGRPIQRIGIDQSPTESGNFGDIITHMDYDDFGRMEKEYLPYATNTGTRAGYRTDALSKITDFYAKEKYEFTTNPYSQKQFEPSPLNRVLKQAAPGNDWKMGNGHEIELAYQTNADADGVKRFDVALSFADNTYTPTIGAKPNFVAGELYKTVTYDENHTSGKNHSVEEFTDKQGRVVLKRTYADINNSDGSVSAAEPHDTYYVYDDFGNLTYVLPPKMNGSIANMNDLGYQYTYDSRNRLVEKRIPGKGKEYIIYNKLDQPIMTQDANQRQNNEWLFTKYDAFGRVAYTGKAIDEQDRPVIQSIVDALTIPLWVEQGTSNKNSEYSEGLDIYYDNGAYPTSTLTEVLTINYYDNYVDLPAGVDQSISILDASNGETNTTNVKGLSTVSKVKVLNQSPVKWIHSLTYYDDKARPIYSYSVNEFLNTVDISETSLDFIGKPLKEKTTHTRGNNTIVTIDNFQYDQVGRLLAQTQCIGDASLGDSCGNGTTTTNLPVDLPLSGTINDTQVASNSITVTDATLTTGAHLYIDTAGSIIEGDQELIVLNTYDALGQLENKKVGGAASASVNQSTGLQNIAYKYNVRGWLTDINDPSNLGDKLFGFSLKYNDVDDASKKLYNGNISKTVWNTMSVNIPNANGELNDVSNSYTYTYDALNRITGATDNTGNYNLNLVHYDKNGNIKTLSRTGHTNNTYTSFGLMDQLTYTYDNGNKLIRVQDFAIGAGFLDGNSGAIDYDYDANGNMTQDLNKGIPSEGITYNHLNLPVQLEVNGINTGNIVYIYDATGVKLQKIATEGSSMTTDYAGNYIYENDSLTQFSNAEGFVEPDGTDWQYVYYLKDHQNNVRITFADDNGNGEIEPGGSYSEIRREQNYYPFGLEHKGYNTIMNGVKNNLKTFQDQEFTEDLGLNTYEWRYRISDPAIGRFWQVDPLAEKYVHNGVYNFSENRVIDGIELEGLERWPINGDGIADAVKNKIISTYNDVKNFFGSEPDDINVNNIGFDVGGGVKDFKFGNAGSLTVEASLFSLSFDKNNGELNFTGPNADLGLFLGNSDLGLSSSLESFNYGVMSKELSVMNIESQFNFFDVGLNDNVAASGGTHLSTFSLFDSTESDSPWFNLDFGTSSNPNRMIDANGDGQLEPMLIFGGEIKMFGKANVEWNVDQTMSRFLGGSGVGSEWKKED